MAFMMAMAACGACRQPIQFNPALVPSIKGEPICEACVRRWEKIHKVKFTIPKGAYEPEEVA